MAAALFERVSLFVLAAPCRQRRVHLSGKRALLACSRVKMHGDFILRGFSLWIVRRRPLPFLLPRSIDRALGRRWVYTFPNLHQVTAPCKGCQ